MTSPRLPRTTWEYCLSAAGELVGWHLVQGEDPQPAARETAVLLAAAVHALAADAGVNGPQVAALLLATPAGETSLLTTLHDHALSALQACPTDELGSGEREQLLAAYGTPQWSAVQTAAQRVVEHHVQDAADHGCPHPTIRDRASAMAAARREQLLGNLDAAVTESW